MSILAGASACMVICSCKKEERVLQTIRGEVYNLCTDSTMAGIPVYLAGGTNGVQFKLKTYTDKNGQFKFENVELRSTYEYAIYVPTEYSPIDIYHNPAEFYGQGDIVYFLMKQINSSTYIPLKVEPQFNSLKIILPKISSPDSCYIRFYQPVFHKNKPEYPWQLVYRSNYYWPDTTHDAQRMGLWKIDLYKYKNGILSYSRDSIYLFYKGNATYTLTW